MSIARRWLLGIAAVPLLYLPLRAAETPPATPPEAATPAASPDGAKEAPPGAERKPEPAATETPPPSSEPDPGDRLSLDNNLSFPVDI